MNLLITGPLGHIGSRLMQSLQPGTYERVVLVDNLATQRYCSLFNLRADVPFQFVEADVCTANLEQLFTGIDVVIHLAAITDATNSFQIKAQVEQVNVDGTRRVAEACLACGCNLIFPSTTSVYGSQQHSVDEDCPLSELKPQSPYAESKLRAEHLLQELGEQAGLRFLICRLGTIFGPSSGMRFHTAVNKFIWQACTGQPLTVWRTALHQQRPYLELGDAVRALQFILHTRRFDNRVYNVLSTNATVATILTTLQAYVPDLDIHLVDVPIMNQLSYEVRNARFVQTGFQFTGTLLQGIGDTMQLFKGIHTVTAGQPRCAASAYVA